MILFAFENVSEKNTTCNGPGIIICVSNHFRAATTTLFSFEVFEKTVVIQGNLLYDLHLYHLASYIQCFRIPIHLPARLLVDFISGFCSRTLPVARHLQSSHSQVFVFELEVSTHNSRCLSVPKHRGRIAVSQRSIPQSAPFSQRTVAWLFSLNKFKKKTPFGTIL